jgi:hypothetical protein
MPDFQRLTKLIVKHALGEIADGDLKELLKPYPADEMKMWSISQRVNSPKNDDPSLVEPLHAQPSSYENR